MRARCAAPSRSCSPISKTERVYRTYVLGSSGSCMERSGARSSTHTRPIIVMRTVTIISNHRPLTIALLIAVMSLVFVRTVGDGRVTGTALHSIKLIHQAQTFHYSQYGRYARSMQELRPLILD